MSASSNVEIVRAGISGIEIPLYEEIPVDIHLAVRDICIAIDGYISSGVGIPVYIGRTCREFETRIDDGVSCFDISATCEGDIEPVISSIGIGHGEIVVTRTHPCSDIG